MPDDSNILYACQRCANCCRWPGEVKVSADEISAIAQFLGMDEAEFLDRHTALRQNRQGLTLLEKPNGECAFLDGIDCQLQAVKPQQCQDFPNKWKFPGWRRVCEAIPIRPGKSEPVVAPETETNTGRKILASSENCGYNSKP